VVQVHYTGAVEAVVPVNPSPRQVRELSQLLPPTGPVDSSDGYGSAATATTTVVLGAAAGDAAAGEGNGMRDQLGVDGVAADSAQGSKGGKGKGSRGYRQRVQQWKAAVSSRMKSLRDGKASRSVSGPGSLTAASSFNEHLLGFGGRHCMVAWGVAQACVAGQPSSKFLPQVVLTYVLTNLLPSMRADRMCHTGSTCRK
jgi:hypothetical protein